MNNVEIVLAVIVIAAIIVILNYLLGGREKTSIPNLLFPRIQIANANQSILNGLWYSINNGKEIPIPYGVIEGISLDSNIINIGFDKTIELSFTEMPNNCYIESMEIILSDDDYDSCDINTMRLNGNIQTTQNNSSIQVRDVISQQNSRTINNNIYSDCYNISIDYAIIDFTWLGVGSVGLKVKKRKPNSETQINVVLTGVDPMIQTTP